MEAVHDFGSWVLGACACLVPVSVHVDALRPEQRLVTLLAMALFVVGREIWIELSQYYVSVVGDLRLVVPYRLILDQDFFCHHD